MQNVLTAGITEADLAEAVRASGYPLQSAVARILRRHLAVQEEWGFIDADDEVARSIDLMAELPLWDHEKGQPHARPALTLIVECKRSELPFVFFISDQKPSTPRFPLIAGLKEDEIVVSTDDDGSTWTYRTISALGLEGHMFLRDSVTFASTFSKCERQGSKLKLSGAEPYNSIVQPIVKALEHYRQVETPPQTAAYFDVIATVGLAVIDAPMIGVKVLDESNSLELVPWLRIPRHRGIEGRSHEHRQNVFAIDVVHASYLDTYLTDHLLPFAIVFAERVIKHQSVIAERKGFVSGMGKNWYRDIEEHLKPSGVGASAKRLLGAAKGLTELAKKK